MSRKNSFYKVDLDIDVKQQFIKVEMELYYPILQKKTDTIEFMLHRDLKVKELNGGKIRNYTFNTISDEMLPEAGNLKVNLKGTMKKGEVIKIRLLYEGQLGVLKPYGDNRLTEDWVEMGLYFPWFPLNFQQVSIHNITYDIKVKIDEGYKVFGMGEIIKKNDHWTMVKDTPTNDIIIMASRDIKVESIEDEDFTLNIYYDKNSEVINKYGLWILSKYKEWFGTTKEKNMSVVFAKGGAYARKGFVVLEKYILENNDYNEIDYFTNMLGHEFAHLWWSNAPADTWESWIDEALAEYSALRVLREKFGEEEFKKAIKIRENRSNNTPPIKNLDMSYEKRKVVIYDKGSLLLYKLEEELGEENFLKLLKEINNKRVSNTEEFLDILTKLFEEDITKKFERLLRDF